MGNTWQAARMIALTEGWHGLYRGVTANFLGATTSWGLYFWWYLVSSGAMHGIGGGRYSIMKDLKRQPGQDALTPVEHLVASAEAGTLSSFSHHGHYFTGALTAICTNPFWVLKTRMCSTRVTDKHAYKSFSGHP